MADGFPREPDTIKRAFIIACSRRALAVQKLDAAHAAVDQAETALLRTTEEVLLRERHVDLCDRAITALLDELLDTNPKVDA